MALIDNCIAYYKLSDPTDETGNHAGTNSADPPAYGAGVIDNAATFVLANSESISLANNFVIGTSVSVSAWFKTASASKHQIIFAIIAGDSSSYYGIQLYNGRPLCSYQTSIGNYINQYSGTALNDNTWRHLVVTFTGGINVPKIYINADSKTVTTLNSGGSPSGDVNQAGCIAKKAGTLSDISLDELGVWDKVLTQTEVTSLYNAGAGFQYPFTTGPDFTKLQINIGDAWKLGADMQINIGDAWKQVAGMQINIGDAWKTVF